MDGRRIIWMAEELYGWQKSLFLKIVLKYSSSSDVCCFEGGLYGAIVPILRRYNTDRSCENCRLNRILSREKKKREQH